MVTHFISELLIKTKSMSLAVIAVFNPQIVSQKGLKIEPRQKRIFEESASLAFEDNEVLPTLSLKINKLAHKRPSCPPSPFLTMFVLPFSFFNIIRRQKITPRSRRHLHQILTEASRRVRNSRSTHMKVKIFLWAQSGSFLFIQLVECAQWWLRKGNYLGLNMMVVFRFPPKTFSYLYT